MASKSTVWMLHMPGLNSKIFLEACEELKLMVNGQLVNITAEQWDDLELICRKKLNLPDDWSEQSYLRAVEEAKSKGWMKIFGPSPVLNRKQLREDRETSPKNQQKEPTDQESLF